MQKLAKKIPNSRWHALERLAVREAQLDKAVDDASCSGADYGLLWNPSADLYSTPEAPGVYVLFFKNKRLQVDIAPDLLSRIFQARFSPGMAFIAFSWFKEEDRERRFKLKSFLQKKSYEALWEGTGLEELTQQKS